MPVMMDLHPRVWSSMMKRPGFFMAAMGMMEVTLSLMTVGTRESV